MHCSWSNRVHFNSITQPTPPSCITYLNMHALTSAVILFAAKAEKIFHKAIMAEQVPSLQLGFGFLNVENSGDFEEPSGEVACNFIKSRSSLIKVTLIFCLRYCYRDVMILF